MTEATPFRSGSQYRPAYRMSKEGVRKETILQAARKGLPAVVVNPSVIMGRRDYRSTARG